MNIGLPTWQGGVEDPEAALDRAVSSMPAGWIVMRHCLLYGTDPPALVRRVLLHPGVGVALFDVAPDFEPDAVARLKRMLDSIWFKGIFGDDPPIVYRVLPVSQLHRLKEVLEYAFAAEQTPALIGGNAWVDVVRTLLTSASVPAGSRLVLDLEHRPAVAGLLEGPMPRVRGPAPRARGRAVLLWSWSMLLGGLAVTAAVLQYLGPPLDFFDASPALSEAPLSALKPAPAPIFALETKPTGIAAPRPSESAPKIGFNFQRAREAGLRSSSFAPAPDLWKPSSSLLSLGPSPDQLAPHPQAAGLARHVEAAPTVGAPAIALPSETSEAHRAGTDAAAPMQAAAGSPASAFQTSTENAELHAMAAGSPGGRVAAQSGGRPELFEGDVCPAEGTGQGTDAECEPQIKAKAPALPNAEDHATASRVQRADTPAYPETPSLTSSAPVLQASIPASMPSTETVAVAAPVPSARVLALLRRGDQMLDIGDISAARLLYRAGADAGSAAAATGMGKTYDPRVLAESKTRGITGDPALAAAWYRKASELGDADADYRLMRLGQP